MVEIDYPKLFERAKIMHSDVPVLSPSQKELRTRISLQEIAIEDILDDRYYMRAFNGCGILEFDLHTIINKVKHPDMRGEAFIAYALKHFQNSHDPVKACFCVLREGMSSYRKFMDEYRKTGNIVRAMESTWWGKVFNKSGYTKIINIEIRDSNSNIELSYPHVVALFSKPQN